MRLSILASLLVLSFLQGCTSESAPVPKGEVEFRETLQIGADSQTAPDYELFQMVSHLEVDSEGNIYLVDSREIAIRVYNKEGQFQYKFGSEGSGPGELKSISDLLIDSHNRLLIIDSSQAQVLAFSLEGNYLNSWELPSLTRVHQIEELSDGRFALLGHAKDKLVHIVDDEFKSIQDSFVNIDDVLTTDDSKERVILQFYPGYILINEDDTIIFAPNHYQGKLMVFRESDADLAWELQQVIKGYSRYKEPVSFSSFEQAERVDLPIVFPGEGRYAAQYHASSQGLYHIDNGGFVHFSLQEKDNYLEMLSEFYNSKGELTSTAVVDTMSSITISVLEMMRGKDLYISDRKVFPKLRRLTISEVN